jgi:uncharacterized phage-like protein YoqJ
MKKRVNIIGVTGHRKLMHPKPTVKNIVREKLHQLEADVVVTGMALGFDMLVAEVCVEEGIPFVAAIPCRGQTKAWPRHEKKHYMDLIDEAWKCKIISSGDFQIWKLFERNKWIINRSNFILGYWDGIPKGGSYATLELAKKAKVLSENLYVLCDKIDG